jgi:alpha-mannosidase
VTDSTMCIAGRINVLRLGLACAALLFAAAQAGARPPAGEPVSVPDRWLQGFVRPVVGEVIVYPWAYPGSVKTLLSRATDGAMAVEWEGEPAPPGPADEAITYVWHAGLNSGKSGGHRFAFSVNGRPSVTFMTSPSSADREWTLSGAAGEVLSFTTSRVSAFDERFGLMVLTAPRSFFGGAPPRFRVVGEAAGSIDYYLSPEQQVAEWTRVTPEEAVLAGGRRVVRVEISHLGAPQPATVRFGGEALWQGTVGRGYLRVEVGAAANGAALLPVTVTIGERETFSGGLPLTPVRARELHLLPHSHVDIGYSDPQPEVERKQWRNLRDAVALGLRTAGYPSAARFRWNVEGLWYVESYLAQAGPDERAAFVAAVRDGTIGLQAGATGILTGLCTPEELRRWTDGARRLRTAYGLPPARSVMQSDVPGVAWPAVAALAQSGVRYFSSGPNYFTGHPDGGDRIGGTVRELGDRPFWWASPSGEERVLFWMAGRGYSWFHSLNAGASAERTSEAILDYAGELAARGYSWDLVQVRYTIGGDNGPVDPDLPDFVRSWNERYEAPRLVIDTSDSLFAEMERRHGAELPVMAGDMTPYWEDGAVSTAAEEAMGRAAARRLAQAQALWALRAPSAFPAAAFADAWRDVTLWHEHTWGAGDSVKQPDRPDVVAQWEFKRRFAVAADASSRTLLAGAAPARGAAIEVVNTTSWPRSGLVLLPAELTGAGELVRSPEGQPLPSQRLADGRLAVWLDGVPALGARRLSVTAGPALPPDSPFAVSALTGDNGHLRVVIDAASGSVSGVFAAAAPGRNLVAAEGGLLRYLYVPGLDPAGAVTGSPATVTLVDAGPLVATWRIDGDAPGAGHLTRTVRLVAGSDEVELGVELDKLAVREKESAHLAFPLAIPDGVVRIDQGEALLEPGRNQLPGSCADFAGAHSAADVANASVGVSLATLDAPLLELGALTDERLNSSGVRDWRRTVAPGSTVYAYLLNNYWHTNYKADQEGRLSFRFALRPHGPFDPVALRRFSEEHDQLLLAFPVDPGAPPLVAPFSLASDAVVLATLRPVDGGRALLIRLFNPALRPATAVIRPAKATARLFLSDEDGRRVAPTDGSLTLLPAASRVLLLE